jgi:hypothetical protein
LKKQILLLVSVALKAADSTQNTYAYKLCDLPLPVHDRKRHCRYEQGGLLAWKHTDISGKVNGTTQRSGFKKWCILLYYSSTEFESTVLFLFIVYWSNVGADWFSSTGLSIWEFPFLRDLAGGNSTVYDNV